MYARMTSAPHPSSFYVLHTRFPIFHAYHMQIHPSLVPPSSLDLALLPLSLSLSLSEEHNVAEIPSAIPTTLRHLPHYCIFHQWSIA